jgi:hypothetical protein
MRPHRQGQEGRGGSQSEAQNFSFTSDDFDDKPPRELQKAVDRKILQAQDSADQRFTGYISGFQF